MKRFLCLLLALPGLAVGQISNHAQATWDARIAEEEFKTQKWYQERSLAAAYNAFGFRLLKETWREKSATNLFLSPASLAFALCMVQNGAGGQTLDEMQQTLGVTNISPTDLNQRNKDLLADLAKADPQVELDIANAIWCDKKAVINPSFIATNQTVFAAQIANGDFQDPATVNAINQWCSDRTHGKIPEIVSPPLDPLLRLILLDAIYFKGSWSMRFDEKFTQNKSFTTASGEQISHPLMAREGEMDYEETPDFQAVCLPYGRGLFFSMYIFLPKNGLAAVVDQLSARVENYGRLALGEWRKGRLELPRFKLENSYDFNRSLQALGIRQAFDEHQANLGGISAEPLCIGRVKQKTYLDVNEEGTEAAAVSGIFIMKLGPEPKEPPPFRMIVDRPFLIAIEEERSGLLLFVGAINDPR